MDDEQMLMSEALFIGVKPRTSKKGKSCSTSWWKEQKEARLLELSCFEDDLNSLVGSGMLRSSLKIYTHTQQFRT